MKPGANGLFDGTDDVVTHFDVAVLGVDDPETVEYREDISPPGAKTVTVVAGQWQGTNPATATYVKVVRTK